MLFLLSSCAATPTTEPEIEMLSIYTSPAAQPWLEDVFECAPTATAIRVVNDPFLSDIALQIGEPELATGFIYQIDTEEIYVVTHRQSSVQNLTANEVRDLFAGQSDLPVEIFVYSTDVDVQRVFEQTVMQGRSITSYARLAVSPQHMSDTTNNEQNTVGILPKHWKVGDSRYVFTIGDVPVLALVTDEPVGVIQIILACLQK